MGRWGEERHCEPASELKTLLESAGAFDAAPSGAAAWVLSDASFTFEVGLGGLPGGEGVEELLVVTTGSEEGLEIGGAVGGLAGLGRQGVFERGELPVAEEVRDVEVDLREDAFELRLGEAGALDRGEVGEVGHGKSGCEEVGKGAKGCEEVRRGWRKAAGSANPQA